MSIHRKALAAVLSLSALAAVPAMAQDAAPRVYYYASQLLGHPYLLDNHLGMRYAAKKFGVEIRTIGPQGWDPAGQAEAVEQAIAKKPAGIITSLWEPGSIPAIKRAMAQGIPVVVIEANMPDSGALTFIGLDNYKAGEVQAKELVRLAGNKGTYAATGNWGASNTDAKFQGLKDYLDKNTEWKMVGKVDDKADTADAIESSKAIFNNYPDINAIVGFDSSSGSGICLAAEELDKDITKLAVVVNDREAPVLECIDNGVIDSTVVNKTALESFMAVQELEAYNDQKVGLANVPISADNKAAGVLSAPEDVYMGAQVINQQNVKLFLADKIEQYK